MKAWFDFLDTQEKELGKETVDKWLRPLKIVKFDACNLYLDIEDSFQREWFEEHVRKKLKNLLNNNHKPIKVHLNVIQSKETKKSKTPSIPAFKLVFDEIDETNTFKTFITSKTTETALTLFLETLSKNLYNPIYLQGQEGSGKTHLLIAAAHFLREKGQKVLFVRAETFTEHVVMAIRQGQMETFRKTYRTCDALIIDDVEVFSKKSATQEELFHTFNTLHTQGKTILLSSSFPPNELKLVEERLISRFEWGILIHLNRLEKEGLHQLLSNHCEKLNFPLDSEKREWLVNTFGSSPKALLKALNAWVLRSHMHGMSNPAEKLLGDLILEEESLKLTPEKIVRKVAEYFGIRIEDILGKSRTREALAPRKIAIYFCREKLALPYMKIGEFFSKDHSTIITTIQQAEKELQDKESDLFNSYKNILKSLETNNHY